jgi:hypothetical protein
MCGTVRRRQGIIFEIKTQNGRIKTGVFFEPGVIVRSESRDPSKIWGCLIVWLGKHCIFMRAPPAVTARGNGF